MAMLCQSGGGRGNWSLSSHTTTLWIHTNNSKHFQIGCLDRCVSGRKNRSNMMTTLLVVKADSKSETFAPLRLKSPTGQFLMKLQQSHPHLFSAAVEQQLQNLAEEKKTAEIQAGHSMNSESDSILYKRIAELKAQERSLVVEEIIYLLVSHGFLEAHITMLPCFSSHKDQLQRIENMPRQEKELTSIHSNEAQEMVWEHVSFILGTETPSQSLDDGITVQISKFDTGSVYASSAAYGYFVRRVDEKFQMEKTMEILSPRLSETEKPKEDVSFAERVSILSGMIGGVHEYPNKDGMSFICDEKPNLLRNYVMSFELDTLYKCATLRSIEMANVIEKQTEALFGRAELQREAIPIGENEVMILTLSGFKRLVLEAVAFGSFLWDAETYVDSYCNIIM